MHDDLIPFLIPYVTGIITGAVVVLWLWFCRDMDELASRLRARKKK